MKIDVISFGYWLGVFADTELYESQGYRDSAQPGTVRPNRLDV